MKNVVRMVSIIFIGIILFFCNNCYAEQTYNGFTVSGVIQIPSIDLHYPILDKVSKSALENSVAILYGAGLNQVGNTVIVGHNYKNHQFFSDISELKENDVIKITDDNSKTVTYKVYRVFETTPDDTSFYQRDTAGACEITLSTTTDDASGRTIVFAIEDGKEIPEISENDEYSLESIEPIEEGPNKSVIKVGSSVLTSVGLINKTDGTVKEIDQSKVEISISNPDLVTFEADGNIKAKAEGCVEILYKYKENNKTYTYKEFRYIVGERFETGDIPLVSSSVINLVVGKPGQEIYVMMVQGGTYAVEYPEGYNEENYYNYDIIVENDKIAKLEKGESKLTVVPVSKGTTKVVCTITTADNKQTIQKVINVNVTEEQQEPKPTEEQKNQTKNEIVSKPENNTPTQNIDKTKVNDEKIPPAGLNGGLIGGAVIVAIIGIVFYAKYKYSLK